MKDFLDLKLEHISLYRNTDLFNIKQVKKF